MAEIKKELLIDQTVKRLLDNTPPTLQITAMEQLVQVVQDVVNEINFHLDHGMPMSMIGSIFHSKVDAQIENIPDRERMLFSCRKGCSHCCHYHVDMNLAEALLIVKFCRVHGIPIDMERLKEQRGKMGLDRVNLEKSACTFLNEQTGMCKIYAVRPANCRKYFVVTPSDDCDSKKNPSKGVAGAVYWPIERVMTGFANTDIPWGGMSEMIERAIKLLDAGTHS